MEQTQGEGAPAASGGIMPIFWMIVKIALLIFVVMWGINYFYKKENKVEPSLNDEFEEQ